MKINEVIFSLCPARFHVIYKDDNGEDKYTYAFGFGVCYNCADYHLKRFAMGQKKHIAGKQLGGDDTTGESL